MLIRLTQDHINLGRQCESDRCPVALAIQDAGVPCQVGVFSIYGPAGSTYWRVSQPESVQQFRQDFDDGVFVEPFEFEFEVPANVGAN